MSKIGRLLEYVRLNSGRVHVKLKSLYTDVTYWDIVKCLEPDYYKKSQFLETNYFQKILYGNDGNDFLRSKIASKAPMMVSRLGGTELGCLEFYLKNRMLEKQPYIEQIRNRISNNAGVFPTDDLFLDKFSDFFLEHVKQVDIMGVLFNDNESSICNSYCPDAGLVELGCIEPYHWKNPWSSALAGKKVLVVHPFAESILHQYSHNRPVLFKNPEILPDFELKTVKSVQSSANAKVDFTTWFDAYQYMCDEIEKTDFDVSLIGAGAYGLPLASFVKRLGKQGINIGGFTQVLFGITGRRYEIEYADTTAKHFNKYWIKPSRSETPENYMNVENGCYW